MARREAALAHMLTHIVGQGQQAHRVRHMLAALADLGRNGVLRAAEPVDQRLVGLGFFHRVEVRPLHVLDDCNLERLAIVHLAHDRGYDRKACPARRAPAALARDDLEHLRLARIGPDQDRHDHALGADRVGQLFKLGLDEGAARLLRIGDDPVDRDVGRSDILRTRITTRACRHWRIDHVARPGVIAQQGGKPTAKLGLFKGLSHAAALSRSRSRCISSWASMM